SAYAIDVSHGDVSQAELLASDAQPPFDEASAEPGDSPVAGDGAGHGAHAEHSEAPAHHGATADDHVEHESPAFSSADSEAATATRATDTFDDGVLDVDGEEEDLLSIDTSVLDPEVHQRLRMLDLASELHDIAALENEHSELFNYQPGLAERVAELKAEVEAERSVSDVLST